MCLALCVLEFEVRVDAWRVDVPKGSQMGSLYNFRYAEEMICSVDIRSLLDEASFVGNAVWPYPLEMPIKNCG